MRKIGREVVGLSDEQIEQLDAHPLFNQTGHQVVYQLPGAAAACSSSRIREEDAMTKGMPAFRAARAQASCDHVLAMLEHMTRHPREGGPEVMEIERFWHPRMRWYGPAGIGTAFGGVGLFEHRKAHTVGQPAEVFYLLFADRLLRSEIV